MACSKGEDHLKEREKKEAIRREIKKKKDREIDELKLTNIHLKLEMEILKAKNSTTKWTSHFAVTCIQWYQYVIDNYFLYL